MVYVQYRMSSRNLVKHDENKSLFQSVDPKFQETLDWLMSKLIS